LVAQTRHPLIKTLADRALSSVLTRLRERRDRAHDIGRFRRGELQGQSMNNRRIGVKRSPSESDGHRAKRTIIVAAVKRANKEAERRRKDARGELDPNAERALSTERSGSDRNPKVVTANPSRGMHPIPGLLLPPSFEKKGERGIWMRSDGALTPTVSQRAYASTPL
jgi:hypothetical protein